MGTDSDSVSSILSRMRNRRGNLASYLLSGAVGKRKQADRINRIRWSYKRTRFAIGALLLCFLGITTTIEGFSTPHQHQRLRRCANQVPLYTHQLPNDDLTGTYESSGNPNHRQSRRLVIQSLLTASAALPLAAVAGKAELDSTGQLYTPKSEMLRGGSAAARGIPDTDRSSRGKLQAGMALQSVYETRFIAYLARFLLNYDPAAHAWWIKTGLGDSWEERKSTDLEFAETTFASFSESVEVGLANYFAGPFGSYSSVSAAKAGILASNPAPSRSAAAEEQSLLRKLIFGRIKPSDTKAPASSADLAKNGILNLFALLKARYTTVAAKRQLVILFSFISSPRLQPTNEIRSLLGEADNATVSEVQILRPATRVSEVDSRTSSRRGGGYSINTFPKLTIADSPALGDMYGPATLLPTMKATSRVLCIQVLDGGAGYTTAPLVTIPQFGIQRECQATAILDRNGSVESIIVLDPGYGYGDRNDSPPKLSIEAPPKTTGMNLKAPRRAKAVAELEYEIVGAQILSGGSGYVQTEPPKVKISPPEEDPDWFLALPEQPELRMDPVTQPEPIRAKVTEMRLPDGNVAFSIDGLPRSPRLDDDLIDRLQRDPLELLPSSVRPVLRSDPSTGGILYTVRSLDQIPQFVAILSPRYRAYDPVFGGVGTVPVTKGALSLSASEYGRLALSGALCTVVVRTALNPLELIKTKQQLQNDPELLAFARTRLSRKQLVSGKDPDETETEEGRVATPATQAPVINTNGNTTKAVKIGTVDMIQSLAEMRGVPALFQSADITFLASIAFGSFGFGATELFRRSFTVMFSDGNDGTGSTIILLFAAAIGTVVTAAAASPLELLRVRSMGQLESKKWTAVLQDFLEEISDGPPLPASQQDEEDFDLKSLNPRDLLPLWAGFAPTLSRELPFAVTKFLTFDIIANLAVGFLNSRAGEGALPVQVGVGPIGLVISAASGAFAGIAGALVSHPADLILTYTSASKRKKPTNSSEDESATQSGSNDSDWKSVVKELLSRDGGIANLFIGLPARSVFFFLVIGLQFFLYDYVKGLFQVGSDDLSLVLDVFYAVRAGLVGMETAGI